MSKENHMEKLEQLWEIALKAERIDDGLRVIDAMYSATIAYTEAKAKAN
jgi:hypothetical protein